MLNQIPMGFQNPNMYFPGGMNPNLNFNYDNKIQDLERRIRELENRLSNIEKKLNIYSTSTKYDYQTSMYMM